MAASFNQSNGFQQLATRVQEQAKAESAPAGAPGSRQGTAAIFAAAQKAPHIQQRNQAQQYRAGMPQMQDRMMTGKGEDARRGLATQMADIQKGASSRGLLNSGLQAGAQQQAQSDTSGQLQAARANVNERTSAQADAMEQMALDTSLAGQDRAMAQAQARQAEADQNYDIALKKRMGEKGNFEKGGAALGSLAGILTAGGGTR